MNHNPHTEHLGDGAYIALSREGSVCIMANSHIEPTDTVIVSARNVPALIAWLDDTRSLDGSPPKEQPKKP